jgi:hypothetical protein
VNRIDHGPYRFDHEIDAVARGDDTRWHPAPAPRARLALKGRSNAPVRKAGTFGGSHGLGRREHESELEERLMDAAYHALDASRNHRPRARGRSPVRVEVEASACHCSGPSSFGMASASTTRKQPGNLAGIGGE